MSTKPWVLVEHEGVAYEVAPEYLYPVGIAEAAALAKDACCELPSPGLVDAIWRASDCKLPPLPRSHNGTLAQMATESVYAAQRVRIEAQTFGRDYSLLAGTHKDVVMFNGKLGIYGWHQLDGTVIQPFFAGHGHYWKDYSQGLRLVRRVDFAAVA